MEKRKMDDLELIRRAVQASTITPAFSTSDSPPSTIKEKAKESKERFEKGYQAIISTIESQSKENTYRASVECNEVSLQECQISEDAKEKLKELENWMNYTSEESLLTLCGFSNEVILTFYTIVNTFYEEKKYQNAVNGFTLLCLLCPKISLFWFSLGLALEADQKYDEALDVLQKALALNPANFDPCLGMIRIAQTLQEYSKVYEMVKKASENPAIKEECEEALNYIQTLKK